MNPALLELVPYVRQGECCSQLLMRLALQLRGEENEGLIRAMRGLCHGIGQSGAACGLLGSGAAVLAWLSGKDGGETHPMLEPLENEYALWFAEKTKGFGGCGCELVVQGLCAQAGAAAPEDGVPDMSLCGEFMAECWEKILDLYDAYGLDSVA